MTRFNNFGIASALLLSVSLAACSGGGSDSPEEETPPVAPDAGADPSEGQGPATETNVIYGTGVTEDGSVNLLLDIFQPEGLCTELRPFVIGMHGGSFIGGDKAGEWTSNAEGLTERGIVGISINYRLLGDNPVISAEYQALLDDILAGADAIGLSGNEDVLNAAVAAIEDAVTAIEWARDNAESRCLDINRFALWGSSSGAIIALHTGYALDDYSLDVPKPLTVVDYWGALFFDNVMQEGEPPLFIIHGTDDITIDFESALALTAQADEVNIPYAFYTIFGGPHGFANTDPANVLINDTDPIEVTYDFIEAHLTDGEPLYESQTLEFGNP